MSVFDWTLNPDQNDKSDPDINWREGQPPSSVNNSARAMMAAVAAWLLDTSGWSAATGSANALVVTLSDLPVQENAGLFSFAVSQPNTGPVTLAFKKRDGTLSFTFPLRARPGTELGNGALRPGVPYLAALRKTDSVVYILNLAPTPDDMNAAIAAGVQTAENYALGQANSARNDAVQHADYVAGQAQANASAHADAAAAQAQANAQGYADNAAGNAQNIAVGYTNNNAWLKSQHGWPLEDFRHIDAGITASTPPNGGMIYVPDGAFVNGFRADAYGGSNFSSFNLSARYLQYFRRDIGGWVTIGKA